MTWNNKHSYLRSSLWASWAVLLSWGRRQISAPLIRVCRRLQASWLEPTQLASICALSCSRLAGLVVVPEREGTPSPLSHRLRTGNSHFRHILLAKASHRPTRIQRLGKWIPVLKWRSCQVTLLEGEVRETDEKWGYFTVYYADMNYMRTRVCWFYFLTSVFHCLRQCSVVEER